MTTGADRTVFFAAKVRGSCPLDFLVDDRDDEAAALVDAPAVAVRAVVSPRFVEDVRLGFESDPLACRTN